jgi:hypothetical protein
MKILRFTAVFMTGACLWAGYQSTSDNLTSIDSSKWTENGTLSSGNSSGTGRFVWTFPK